MDVPGERSMHVNKTPTLGGIGIFIAFSLTIILFAIFTDLSQTDLIKLLSLLGGITILLFLGIKDDILVLSPRKKIIGQIFAATMVVLMTDIRIDNFGGLLGIEELHPFFSIIFSIFIFIFIINAFNLTDGIDGLAASIAIFASTVFGIFFLINGSYLMTFVSFILVSSLVGFLRFNLSDTQKIFMGDSGSMFVGFILAFQGIALLGMSGSEALDFKLNGLPVIVLAVFAFPILDTTRVFFIRLKQGRSPFSADRNHIHHRLLDLGFTHKSATIIICAFNTLIVALTLFVDFLNINIHFLLLIVLIIVPLLHLFPFFIEQEKDKGTMKFAKPKLTF